MSVAQHGDDVVARAVGEADPEAVRAQLARILSSTSTVPAARGSGSGTR